MGINKPNVRYVIHYDLPKNVESYYQETGRAGRDRLDSECILFFSYGDRKKIEALIEKSTNPQKKAIAYRKLDEMIKFCENLRCRRKFLLGYFGENYTENCGKCDTCLTPRQTIDGTDIAIKILTCIKETNQRFGMNYIISVLTAAGKSRQVRNMRRSRLHAFGHDKISSYGKGNGYSQKQWQIFIRELIQLGIITVAGDKYPVLKLNYKSFDVLSGRADVSISKPKEKMKEIQELSRDKQQTISHEALQTMDYKLFEILRALRKDIADIENMPPYIIFPDFSIQEMATFFPQSIGSMAKIKGMGDIKLERYGQKFLEKIIAYCNENGIPEKPIYRNPVLPKDSFTYKQTLDLVRQGLTIEEIANKRNFATSTIAGHIEKLLFSGEQIDISMFVSKEKQDVIAKCMNRLHTQGLTQIKETLGDGFTYEEIKLVRAKTFPRKR